MHENVTIIEAKDEPFVVAWDERRVTWDQLRPDGLGWQRARLEPTLSGSNFRFAPYCLPFGRSRPFHLTPNSEQFIFVLEGEMEWGIGPDAKNLRWFRLGPYDALFVPNGHGTNYRTVGRGDARYLCGFSRIGDEWTKDVIWTLPGEEKPLTRDNIAWKNETKGK